MPARIRSTLIAGFTISLLVHGVVLSMVGFVGFNWSPAGKQVSDPTSDGLQILKLERVDEPQISRPSAIPTGSENFESPVGEPTTERSLVDVEFMSQSLEPQISTSPVNISDARPDSIENGGNSDKQVIVESNMAAGLENVPSEADVRGIAGVQPVRTSKPPYPPEARRRGQQGTVILEVVVSPSGSVKSAVVKQSSGFMLLDRAAEKAMRKWLFSPTPSRSVVEVPIRFQLQ